MNKKGFFFFIEWGKDNKQEQLIGVKLNIKCSCGEKKFNVVYNLQRDHLLWFIPISSWEVQEVFIQCVKCGAFYKLDEKGKKEAIELYEKIKEGKATEKEIDIPKPKKEKPKKIKVEKVKPSWLSNFR